MKNEIEKKPINKAAARAWLKLLRSGKYKQTRGRLRNARSKAMCCLGVACEASQMGYWKGDSRFSKNMTYMIVNEKGLLVSSAVDELPVPVMGWLGLTELNPTVVLKDGTSTTLAALNDVSHRSFKEIADVIEANFKL